MNWERFGLVVAAFLAVQAYLDLKKRLGIVEKRQEGPSGLLTVLELVRNDIGHLRRELSELKEDFRACRECKVEAI